MMRRRLLIGTAGGGAAPALAACGATEGSQAGGAGSAPAGGTPQPVAWSMYGDQTTRPAFEAIQTRFNEQKQGKYVASLNLVNGTEYIDKMLAALAADSPTDVFLTYAQYKPAWVKKGLLLDVTDRWKTSKTVNTKMYYPPVVDAISYQNKQWGTPWGYNATVMFHVVDRFKERNIPLPAADWTMADYAALAKRLTDPEKKIFGTDQRRQRGRAADLLPDVELRPALLGQPRGDEVPGQLRGRRRDVQGLPGHAVQGPEPPLDEQPLPPRVRLQPGRGGDVHPVLLDGLLHPGPDVREAGHLLRLADRHLPQGAEGPAALLAGPHLVRGQGAAPARPGLGDGRVAGQHGGGEGVGGDGAHAPAGAERRRSGSSTSASGPSRRARRPSTSS